MDFNYSEMQQMLLDSGERFVADTYGLEQSRAQRELPNGLNQSNWGQFAELGWLALPIPEADGGLGGSLEDVVVLSTLLGRGLAVEPYTSTVVLGAFILAAAPDPDLKADLLGRVVTGEVRLALAHDEPGERYGDAGPRATAAAPSGNGYTLSGAKTLALDAPSATHLIVSARLDGRLALFVVEADAAGLATETYPLIDGAAAADLTLDATTVGANALIAEGAQAEALLAAAQDRAQIATMAQAVGSMEACLDICSAYLKERQQFGQSIGKFQSLQHMMADMFVATHQSRSILYQALASADADDAKRAAAVSAAKLLIGEASQLVSRNGIQLHGGYGITDEYLISHHYRRLLSLEKQYGDIDHHVRRLADLSLGAPSA